MTSKNMAILTKILQDEEDRPRKPWGPVTKAVPKAAAPTKK